MKPDEYLNTQIDAEISPEPTIDPNEPFQDFMKRTESATRPVFDGAAPGTQELHLKAMHEAKKHAGVGLARSGGGVIEDPEQIYNAMVRGNPAYANPTFDADMRELFMGELNKYPAAKERFENSRKNAEAAHQRNLTPDMQTVRGELSPQAQEEFDRRLDEERLSKVFTNNPDTPPGGEQPFDPTKPVDIGYTPVPVGALPRAPGQSQSFRDFIDGLTIIDGESRDEFMERGKKAFPDASESELRERYNEHRDLRKTMDVLNLDPVAPESIERAKQFQNLREEHDVSHLTFLAQQNKILRDAKKSATYGGLSDAGKIAFIKHQMALKKIEGRSSSYGVRHGKNGSTYLTPEGERMKALREIDSRVAAGEFSFDDLATHHVFSVENDRHALNAEAFEGMLRKVNDSFKPQVEEFELPDGTKQVGIQTKRGGGWQIRNYKADQPPGIYEYAGGVYEVLPTGKTVFMKNTDGVMGDDGEFHPYIHSDPKNDKSPLVPDFPKGVSAWTGGEFKKKPAQSQSELPSREAIAAELERRKKGGKR